MRIVVCSDAHLDKSTMGVPRMREGVAALDRAADHAMEIGADWFLFLGDAADPDVDVGGTLGAMAVCVRTALRLARGGVGSVWIDGNHDVDEGGSGLSTLSPIGALEVEEAGEGRIHHASRPRLIYLGQVRGCGLQLLCLPFAPVSHAYDPAAEARQLMAEAEAEGSRVIVAAHLMVPGVVPGEETEEMPRGRDMPFPFAETSKAVLRLEGHYHTRQTFDPRDGGPPIAIPGSMMRLTAHDEESEPGFLVIEDR